MQNEHRLTDKIIVDHLAFSVPLASFKHLSRAGSEASKRYQWHKMPAQKWRSIKDIEQIKCDKHRAEEMERRHEDIINYNAECEFILFQRFKQFMSNIMSLKLSNARDKGLHGYTNSYRLLDITGRSELGFVGFGGNNNTIYVQISGEGCKHVFDKIRPFVLHFWLSKVLTVEQLSRIDLAYDDFDGNYCTEYALKSYADDAFNNPNGGKKPILDPKRPQQGAKLVGDTIYVGSRKSTIFWRIYNKALEQGTEGVTWYRSEVELKKVSVDVLQNPAKAFAGINRFSASINLEHGNPLVAAKKRTVLDFNSRIKWAKRQCGRTLSDVLEAFGGDIYQAYGALCEPRGGKFAIPDTQTDLLNKILNEDIHHES